MEYKVIPITCEYLEGLGVPLVKSTDVEHLLIDLWYKFVNEKRAKGNGNSSNSALEDSSTTTTNDAVTAIEHINTQMRYNGLFVRTNYPFIFYKKKSTSIDPLELQAQKCFYVPPWSQHSSESIREYRKLLEYDAKMHYYGLLHSLGVRNVHNNSELYRLWLRIRMALGPAYMHDFQLSTKLSLPLSIAAIRRDVKRAATRPGRRRQIVLLSFKHYIANHMRSSTHWLVYYQLCRHYLWQCVLPSRGVVSIAAKRQYWSDFIDYLDNTWSLARPVKFSHLSNVRMQNECMAKQLQGKNSTMRREAISPKILSSRAQILVRSELDVTEIVLPMSLRNDFQKYMNCNLQEVPEFNLANPNAQPEAFADLRSDAVNLLKRDPAIAKTSLVHLTRMAFARCDTWYMGLLALIGLNADCDGDALHLYQMLQTALARIELELSLSPDSALHIGYLKLRLDLTESHVTYMYKRCLPHDHRYHRLYESMRVYCTRHWLVNVENLQAVQVFLRKFSTPVRHCVNGLNIFDLIEPTRFILQSFLVVIYALYGSRECMRQLREFNAVMAELACYSVNRTSGRLTDMDHATIEKWRLAPRYQRVRPRDLYVVSNPSIYFDHTVLSIAISEAKGSLEHYNQLVQFVQSSAVLNDRLRQPELSSVAADTMAEKFDALASKHHLDFYKRIHEQSVTTLQHVEQSVRAVPNTGHESFKSNIEFNGFSFTQDGVYFHNRCMYAGNPEELFFHTAYMNESLLTFFLMPSGLF